MADAAPLRLDALFAAGHPDPAALGAVMAHPRFGDAMRVVMGGWLGMMRDDPVVNTVMADPGRLLVSVFAVYLDGHGGLTPGRLKAVLVPHNVSSAGRIDALLALMQRLGFLDLAPSDDRRIRRLRPTARLLDGHRHRTEITLRGIGHVLAEGEDGLAALPRDGFLETLLGGLAEIYLAGNFYWDLVPDMRLLLEHNGGLSTVFSLLMSGAPDDDFPPKRSVPASVTGLARRHGVSRAQMRRIFAQSEAERMIAPEPGGHEWRLLPRLDSAIRHLAANYILSQAEAVRRALA